MHMSQPYFVGRVHVMNELWLDVVLSATGLDKRYQAHAQSIEQLEQMMHAPRDSCVPASTVPCAPAAVSCLSHLCGSPALQSAVLRGAEHRGSRAGVQHTRCCMESSAVSGCVVCTDPVRPVPRLPSAPCPPTPYTSSVCTAQHSGQDSPTQRRRAPPIRNVQTRSTHIPCRTHAACNARNSGAKGAAPHACVPLDARAVVLSNLLENSKLGDRACQLLSIAVARCASPRDSPRRCS